MRVKSILSGIFVLILLTSCANEPSDSPEEIGKKIGSIGAETWYKNNPNAAWPSPESAGEFCANSLSDVATVNGWELDETLKAANACGDGFLGKLRELNP